MLTSAAETERDFVWTLQIVSINQIALLHTSQPTRKYCKGINQSVTQFITSHKMV